MTLAYPWMLAVLLLIPLLMHLRFSQRRKASVQFSNGRILRELPLTWAVAFQWVLPATYCMGLFFLSLAMTRPQKGLEETIVHSEGVDIVLLVDVSTSMRAVDFSTKKRRMDRLDSAKEVIERFVKTRRNDRIGMVAFAALPYAASPLTLDHDWLIQQLNRLETGMLEDGTAIGSALGSAINRLRDSEAESKVVVLLTDGVNNAGTLSPINAAQMASALGIRVYTVGAGSTGLVDMPVKSPFGQTYYVRQPSEIDEVTLQEIARITGAKYFRATSMDELNSVYDQIDEMEKTKVEIEQYMSYEERFQPLLLLAIGFLGLEKLLSLTRLGRLP